jgi:hypothetical protein
MRLLRFSIRRLLLLTGLVGVLLYLLYIRPVTVAKEFIHTMQTADVKEISRYLENVGGEAAHVECVLNERSWADVFSCRQTFVISLVSPDPVTSTIDTVENHHCYSTPFGVKQQAEYVYVEAREKKQ